jgi:hypothetical protein
MDSKYQAQIHSAEEESNVQGMMVVIHLPLSNEQMVPFRILRVKTFFYSLKPMNPESYNMAKFVRQL